MAALLAIYVAAHSPLRGIFAARLGLGMRACYFGCTGVSVGRIAVSLAALTLVTSALLAAWVVADRWDGPTYEWPLSFGLAAIASIVVPAAALGGFAAWRGITILRAPGGPFLAAVPAVAIAAGGIRCGWRPCPGHPTLPRPRGLVALLGGLAIALLTTLVAVSLMHPPTGYDALAYHAPLAVALWREGNLGTFLDHAPSNYTLANPGTAELWFGLLRLAGGERLADLAQLPFAALGAAATAAFARRLGLRDGAATLVAWAWLLAPLVIMQSGMQWNDLTAGALLMATAALAAAPASCWTAGRLALVGIGLGLTATTKLALLPSVGAVGVFIAGALLWQHARRRDGRALFRRLTAVTLAFCIVAAPWWSRNLARYANPVYPAELPFVGRGYSFGDSHVDARFVPTARAWPAYPLLEPHSDQSGLGALFAVGAVPGLALAVRRCRRQPLVLYGVIVAITLPAWWALTPHDPRFLLAPGGLGLAFLPWSLLALPRPRRWIGGALLVAAALFSALVTLDQALLPYAKQPNTRAEFYDRVWGIDPATADLPESEGLLYNAGYASLSYVADYPLMGPSLARLVIFVDADAPIEAIVGAMRDAGVRYASVPAAPESVPVVEAKYAAAQFTIVHVSLVDRGPLEGTRRYLFRLNEVGLTQLMVGSTMDGRDRSESRVG